VATLPNVKVVLSGMSTMEQVDDNIKTFGDFKPMSEEELATVDKVVNILNNRVQNGCTGCSYCMPCPAGVNIPKNFRIWNTYHMYQNYNAVRWNWETEMPDNERADKCIECGKCEAICPQALNIREDLKRVMEDLEKKEMIL
jgi:predicted aldo/keto reductase-like oxidoreductase